MLSAAFFRTGSVLLVLLLVGCSDTTSPDRRFPPPPPPPADAISRLVLSYEQKKAAEYQGMFTGDYTYEFSASTDPTLVQQYSTGWFKADETESSSHLFAGYTPPGGATREPASTISITLADTSPVDDNTSGVNPKTHKVLATRVDGSITVPRPGANPITYVIANNREVFYLVRGDVAVNLDDTQPADSLHWYIYRWVDLSAGDTSSLPDSSAPSDTISWGALKGLYRQ